MLLLPGPLYLGHCLHDIIVASGHNMMKEWLCALSCMRLPGRNWYCRLLPVWKDRKNDVDLAETPSNVYPVRVIEG